MNENEKEQTGKAPELTESTAVQGVTEPTSTLHVARHAHLRQTSVRLHPKKTCVPRQNRRPRQ